MDSQTPDNDSASGQDVVTSANSARLRNTSGEYERSISDAEKDAAAARRRAEGWTLAEIAAEQGIAISTAQRRVKRAMLAAVTDSAVELRAASDLRFDSYMRATLAILAEDHPVVWKGEVVKGLTDPRPKLQALQVLTNIEIARLRMNGAMAPIKHDVRVSDKLTAEIADLARQLGVDAVPTVERLELEPVAEVEAQESRVDA